ncbi:DNA photolyase, FAD-binding/Cryptochrome [Tribonema minus]|uniref:Deoxyribodipyrimidine photo-lyase n=1 Tax=Tribonema minus TaxID=303371 RepID=A0A835Z6D6_9STRA|nr:DNA photolyase, FAD-binding/Cryptochrome [Tribonema minus]
MSKRAASSVDAAGVSKKGKKANGGGSATGPSGLPPSPEWFDDRRVRCLTAEVVSQPRASGGCVVYWMSRDQRAEDNWAMLYARHLAQEASVPLVVAFNLVPRFLAATIRHFGFMLRGLEETEADLRAKRVPFHLLRGAEPADTVPEFARAQGAVAVVCDMSPLRVPRAWTEGVAAKLAEQGVPVFQVDAHNIVPVWTVSDKQETGARTLRPKIDRLLTMLTDVPPLAPNAEGTALPPRPDWAAARETLEVDRSVQEVKTFTPGAAAGRAKLQDFIDNRLKLFATGRNDPNVHASSDLSPYLHFGQLSVQRAVLEVRASKKSSESTKSYVEEAVVRRELSDNFCFYNADYDSLAAAANWARDSLALHASDAREHTYTRDDLEAGRTHDDLWNAAQIQMVQEGKMHGFLRMYWAKKILEWTPSPAEALATAIYLNDRYELDGRDPNGYVGIAWSIMGIHDMGWTERPIFGKIRYMNYAGCMRKFNVASFVARYPAAVANCKAAGGEPAKPKKARATATKKSKK